MATTRTRFSPNVRFLGSCFTGMALFATLRLGANAQAPSTQATTALPPIPTNHLVLHLSLDEADGQGWTYDRSPSKLRARTVNVRWIPTGRVGGACDFMPEQSYLAVSNPVIGGLTSWTFSVWFRLIRLEDRPVYLFDKGTTNGLQVQILPAPGDSNLHGRVRLVVGSEECMSTNTVADRRWHHLAIVADGCGIRLWLDGTVQPGQVAWSVPWPTNAHPWVIGMNLSSPAPDNAQRALNGVVDDWMVFNRALSEEELAAIRAAAQPRFTRGQVQQRLREIHELYQRGLLLPDFYERKLLECEANL